jgi:hypothetical protein
MQRRRQALTQPGTSPTSRLRLIIMPQNIRRNRQADGKGPGCKPVGRRKSETETQVPREKEMTVETDVVIVLDTCRMFPGVLSSDDLRLFSGLNDKRLSDAGKVISRSGLVKLPTGGGMVWPTNDAVLANHRAGAI